jgi:hypothetical protein
MSHPILIELERMWMEPDGRWYYLVEQYPYAAADQWVTYGPFATRQEAEWDWIVVARRAQFPDD